MSYDAPHTMDVRRTQSSTQVDLFLATGRLRPCGPYLPSLVTVHDASRPSAVRCVRPDPPVTYTPRMGRLSPDSFSSPDGVSTALFLSGLSEC